MKYDRRVWPKITEVLRIVQEEEVDDWFPLDCIEIKGVSREQCGRMFYQYQQFYPQNIRLVGGKAKVGNFESSGNPPRRRCYKAIDLILGCGCVATCDVISAMAMTDRRESALAMARYATNSKRVRLSARRNGDICLELIDG